MLKEETCCSKTKDFFTKKAALLCLISVGVEVLIFTGFAIYYIISSDGDDAEDDLDYTYKYLFVMSIILCFTILILAWNGVTLYFNCSYSLLLGI
jgi:hypothetical protein